MSFDPNASPATWTLAVLIAAATVIARLAWSLKWVLLAAAVLVYSCSNHSKTEWQQRYDTASPATRLQMDVDSLTRARQWNLGHGRPQDEGNDDARTRIVHDLEAVRDAEKPQ